MMRRGRHSTRWPTFSGSVFPEARPSSVKPAPATPRRLLSRASFLHQERLDFSFSGLKTAVLYAVHGQGIAHGPRPEPGQRRADLAASFQQAVVDVLAAKARQALRAFGQKRLAVGGGVAANHCLRSALETMARAEGVELFIPPMNLCTDNAAMAAVAVEKWRAHLWAPADLDACPTSQ